MAGWRSVAAGVVVLALVAVGARQCMRDSGAEGGATSTDDDAARARAAADAEARARADAERRALIEQRDLAYEAAVSTVHRYLAALGGTDRALADAFWRGGAAPADPHEADLRTLTSLRALRSENGMPKALDEAPVPQALEIPVTLHAGMTDGPVRRYSGWYRLRRSTDGTRWEITSARIDPVPPR